MSYDSEQTLTLWAINSSSFNLVCARSLTSNTDALRLRKSSSSRLSNELMDVVSLNWKKSH